MLDVFEDYKRVSENYHLCLDCIEKVLTIAAKDGNMEIGKVIENCLNNLHKIS